VLSAGEIEMQITKVGPKGLYILEMSDFWGRFRRPCKLGADHRQIAKEVEGLGMAVAVKS